MEDTTKQDQVFLDCLFDTALNPNADLEVAKKLAGIPEHQSTTSIIRRIKGDYQNEVHNYFLSIAPLAANQLLEIINGNKPVLNADRVIKACIEVLDRAGISKKEKQEIEMIIPDGVIILPPLNPE